MKDSWKCHVKEFHIIFFFSEEALNFIAYSVNSDMLIMWFPCTQHENFKTSQVKTQISYAICFVKHHFCYKLYI